MTVHECMNGVMYKIMSHPCIPCQAYRLGFRYPKYIFMTYGWYADKWWTGSATSSQYNCTAEERATILPYTMGPLLPEFPADLDAEAEPGIVSLILLSTCFYI